MTIKEVIGDCTLYMGDARSIEISDVDCIVTDPPYRLTSGGNTTHPDSMQGGWMKEFKNTGDPVTCDIEWSEIMAILNASIEVGDCYVMVNNRNIGLAWMAAIDAGLKEHNTLVWDKVSCTANRWYMKNCEFIWYFYKGAARTINKPSSKQLIKFPQKDVTAHPTEKPVELMRHYIENSTDPGQLIFDPFMGSGTTGEAAIKSGRKFVGIEIEQKWFDVACDRLSKIQHQGEMFAA